MVEVLIITIYILRFLFSYLCSAKAFFVQEQFMMESNLRIFPMQKDR